jgi:hypothetical protein
VSCNLGQLKPNKLIYGVFFGSFEGLWNCAHIEGSIMEGYIIEEVECYVDYVKNEKRIDLPIPLHEGRLSRRGRMSQKTFIDEDYNLVRHISVYYINS